MVEVTIENEKEKAKSFWKYNTYVFVQTDTNYYNGYICQVTDSEIIFMDDNIPAPFPIPFSTLKYPIVPSNKEKKL